MAANQARGDAPAKVELRSYGTLIPMQDMNIVLNVEQYVAQVAVETEFINIASYPIEAVFTFQQEDTAIYEFEVRVGDKVLVSVCKEKEEAANKYDDAIASGNGAYMITNESDDIFTLNVGNIPPMKECVITIKYATLLKTVGDAVKLSIPIAKAPVPSFSLVANIAMNSPIVGVESKSHEVQYDIDGNNATVTTKPNENIKKKFEMVIGMTEIHKEPSATLEVCKITSKTKEENGNTLMISYYPEPDNNIFESDVDIPMEFVFLVDRSWSMSGSKIEQVVNALQLFLRSIPVGSLFNIVGFGSKFELLFDKSMEYNDATFAKASAQTAKLEADLAGTKIYEPLKHIFDQPTNPNFPRQIIVLTDGQVTDEEKVIALVKKNNENTRVFTLGIGSDASTRLVVGLATAGKGHAELVANDERMEVKVLSQLKRAMQPFLQVSVDWGSLSGNVQQSPAIPPPVFPGNPIVIFGMLNRETTPEDESVTLKLSNASGLVVHKKVPLNPHISRGAKFGVLAASASIREVEKRLEEKKIEEKHAKAIILPLALKYSVVSRFTSLLIEELRTEAVAGTMTRRDILVLKEPKSTVKSNNGPLSLQSERPRGVESMNTLFGKIYARGSSSTSSYAAPSYASSGEGNLLRERSSNSSSSSSSSSSSYFGSSLSNMWENVKSSASNTFSFGGLFAKMYSANSVQGYAPSSSYTSEGYASSYSPQSPYGGESTSSSSSTLPPPSPSSTSASKGMSLSTKPKKSVVDVYEPKIDIKETASTRPLDRLIVLQKASGNWTLDDALLSIAKLTRDQLITHFAAENEEENEKRENVIATALSLALLELQFADSVDEWSMLRDKAMRWLRKELQKSETATAEGFVKKAKDLVSTL